MLVFKPMCILLNLKIYHAYKTMMICKMELSYGCFLQSSGFCSYLFLYEHTYVYKNKTLNTSPNNFIYFHFVFDDFLLLGRIYNQIINY
jgi:radical SAM superfamily enzyme with C-terminal helix-hairpin-helix motif